MLQRMTDTSLPHRCELVHGSVPSVIVRGWTRSSLLLSQLPAVHSHHQKVPRPHSGLPLSHNWADSEITSLAALFHGEHGYEMEWQMCHSWLPRRDATSPETPNPALSLSLCHYQGLRTLLVSFSW